jgi:hypothetical protein
LTVSGTTSSINPIVQITQNNAYLNGNYALQVGGGAGAYTNLGGIRINGFDTQNTILQTAQDTDLSICTNNNSTSGNINLVSFGVNSTLSFYTNSTRRMLIAGNGNVGFGTGVPGSKLDIWNGSLRAINDTSSGYITINPSDTTHAGFIEFYSPSQVKVGYLGYTSVINTQNYLTLWCDGALYKGLNIQNELITNGNAYFGSTIYAGSTSGSATFITSSAIGLPSTNTNNFTITHGNNSKSIFLNYPLGNGNIMEVNNTSVNFSQPISAMVANTDLNIQTKAGNVSGNVNITAIGSGGISFTTNNNTRVYVDGTGNFNIQGGNLSITNTYGITITGASGGNISTTWGNISTTYGNLSGYKNVICFPQQISATVGGTAGYYLINVQSYAGNYCPALLFNCCVVSASYYWSGRIVLNTLIQTATGYLDQGSGQVVINSALVNVSGSYYLKITFNNAFNINPSTDFLAYKIIG